MNGVYELKYYSNADAVPSYATSIDDVEEYWHLRPGSSKRIRKMKTTDLAGQPQYYWQLVDNNVVMVLIIIYKDLLFKMN